jgi:hypothetical protein
MSYVLPESYEKSCNLLPLTTRRIQALSEGSRMSNETYMPLVENINSSPLNKEFTTNSE